MDAVFLEKGGIAQIVGAARPRAVAAHGGGPCIGGDPGIHPPVGKVPQLAAVQFVHGLAVHHAVLAAPDAVLRLAYIVHVRHGPLHRHRAHRLLIGQVDQPHHHDGIVVFGKDDLGAVQLVKLRLDRLAVTAVGNAADLHAVALFERLSDAHGLNSGVHGGHACPHLRGSAPHHQAVGRLGGVDPEIAARRLLRLGGADLPQRFTCGRTQGIGHRAAAGKDRLHATEVGQVLGVHIHLVRPYQQVRAHAHQLLFALAERQPHDLCAVVVQLPAVHPRHGILGQHAARRRELPHHAPCLPALEQWIAVRGHVGHVVPFIPGNAPVVVVAAEGVDHLPALADLRQCWKLHRALLTNTAPLRRRVHGCGCTSF